ncbi:hypothetical protein E2C01_097591 [Portunus trituberculatus]|uniref:Uncharacterized protein n=1 Tax=Portunus trituberculatus TaxID=210409 RepID=A0A5B7K585_PORTR|nr:hypothetical protein [Portunus trituberculatus]
MDRIRTRALRDPSDPKARMVQKCFDDCSDRLTVPVKRLMCGIEIVKTVAINLLTSIDPS